MFDGQPDTLAVRVRRSVRVPPSLNAPQLAMLCALVGSSLWVNNASRLGLPVSTSHSIVGATVGVGIAFRGPSCVLWGDARHGVASIVLSWVISPLMAALFGAALFLLTKHGVLKARDPHARRAWCRRALLWFRTNALPRAVMLLYPAYMTVTFMIVILFMVIAGAPRLHLAAKDASGRMQIVNPGAVAGVTIALSLCVYAAAWYAKRTPWFTRYVDSLPGHAEAHAHASGADLELAPLVDSASAAAEKPDAEAAPSDDSQVQPLVHAQPSHTPLAPASGGAFAQVRALALSGVDVDVTTPQDEGAKVAHDIAVRYDARTERLFSACQVFTASFASLAHGSNDVANAIAPLAVIQAVWREGGSSLSGVSPTPTWCLAYGAFWLDVGLVLMGYRVMRSLGNNITYHSPSRGFSMELAALTTVLWASSAGAVVSTTHVITGSTVGVGLCTGTLKAVNWRMVAVTMFGWVLTLPCAALVSGLCFALLAKSPKALSAAQARPGLLANMTGAG